MQQQPQLSVTAAAPAASNRMGARAQEESAEVRAAILTALSAKLHAPSACNFTAEAASSTPPQEEHVQPAPIPLLSHDQFARLPIECVALVLQPLDNTSRLAAAATCKRMMSDAMQPLA